MTRKKDLFKVKFRGVRGSYPTPDSNKLKYGGNTACVEVQVGNHLIILDAGTGIINLGEELLREHILTGSDIASREPISLTILVSHSHLDHLMGLPYFKPIFISSSKINIFGMSAYSKCFKDIIAESIFAPFFPLDFEELSASVNLNDILENKIIILKQDNPEPIVMRSNSFDDAEITSDDVVIHCFKSYAHPKDGVLVYKICYKNRSMVYSTDKESYAGGDIRLINFARNADLLIHDAQYTTDDYTSPVMPRQGFGHSTPKMAVDSAQKANVKRLILFHIDPTYDDEKVEKIETEVQSLFENAHVAYENMEISLR
ncbi:MAG: MBL fold metallo-hydrolase [Candidatus Gastranaerophilaceae bacterium]|jgi:ribonuclease BN (tRNA processing enzyme)